jgi:hypothetical protein
MPFDKKDWDIICETLQDFQQKLEAKINAYSTIYAEQPYPTELQRDAVWLKEVLDYAQKLLQLQKDFIEMIKKGP